MKPWTVRPARAALRCMRCMRLIAIGKSLHLFGPLGLPWACSEPCAEAIDPRNGLGKTPPPKAT
jgi:hypothetical protein